jgi:hypothetical protein
LNSYKPYEHNFLGRTSLKKFLRRNQPKPTNLEQENTKIALTRLKNRGWGSARTFFLVGIPFVGCLNFRREISDSLQKESAQTDPPKPRKHLTRLKNQYWGSVLPPRRGLGWVAGVKHGCQHQISTPRTFSQANLMKKPGYVVGTPAGLGIVRSQGRRGYPGVPGKKR